MWVCKFCSEPRASWEPCTDIMLHCCGKTETSLTTNDPYRFNKFKEKRYAYLLVAAIENLSFFNEDI